jgi:hypothetical protein
VTRPGEKRNAYRNLVGKPDGKKLRNPRCMCGYTIKMGLKWIELDGVDWIQMAQDSKKTGAVIKTIINMHFPKNAGKIKI